MVRLVVVFLIAVLLVSVAQTGATTRWAYTTHYDYIDVDQVLKNSRLYTKYFECLMGQGKCTPEAKELRDKLPEALQTNCAMCSERQANESHKVIRFLIQQRPEDFRMLEAKYDPSGLYMKRYEEEIKLNATST
uniref:Putative chemosensory protein 5 n=1 Tax=Lygus hesperus TaxID=30085 RepID=A0A1L2JVG7_LYGHE|nr:putative chemosensory protein 5 [Lygus hesperus]